MTFDPSTYPGYLGHSDVVSGANVYTDNGGTTLTSTDGATVQYWRKNAAGSNGTFLLSGLGAAGGPTLKNGVRPTGLDALRFDGSNDMLRCVDASLAGLFIGTGQDFTVYVVCGRVTSSGNILMSWNPFTSSGGYGYLQVRNNGGSPTRQIVARANVDVTLPTDATALGATEWAVVTIKYTASTGKCRIYTNTNAGVEQSSGSGTAGIDQVVLGGLARSSGGTLGFFCAFDIGTICWFNQAHSDADRLAIINGLAADSLGAPPTPTGVTATAISYGVDVSWAVSTGAESYVVERSANGTSGWTTIATVTAPRLYYADTSYGQSATTWYYRVSATNLAGTSAASSTVNATTLGAPTSAAHVAPCYGWWRASDLGSVASSISSWLDNIASRSLAQATGANQPAVASWGSGTVTKVASFDGTNDYLIYDAAGPVFEGDVSVCYMRQLGSGAGRTGNECDHIAVKAGTNNQTLDQQAVRAGGSGQQLHCRLNDGSTQHNVGAWAIDTAAHLLGMTSRADGLGRMMQDNALTPYVRLRPHGGALTFDKWTWGAHRRESIEAYALAKYGDIGVWQRDLNADQWRVAYDLWQPRFGTPTTADAHPVQFLSNVVACHWAAAFQDKAGGALSDGDALATNYQWTPQFRFLAEMTKGSTSVTWEANESPTGLPACAIGSGGLWQENVAGNMSGQVGGTGAWSWWFVAKAASLSGSAQSFGSLTDNGASGTYLTVRVNASGAYELAAKDNAGNSNSASGGTADTSIHLFKVTRSGDSYLLYVDGVLRVTLSLSPGAAFTFTRFVMGGLYRGSLSEGFTDLRLFEFGLTTATFSPTERTAFVTYSAARYGTPAGAQDVTLSGIGSTAALGQPTVAADAATISPAGIASAAALGAPTITTGAVTVSPTGLGSTTALGSPTVAPDAADVSLTGIGSGLALGSPTVTPGEVTVLPSGLASGAVVGAPAVSPGPVTVALSGIPSGAALGSPAVQPGPVTLLLTGIPSGAAFGTVTVSFPSTAVYTYSVTLRRVPTTGGTLRRVPVSAAVLRRVE